MTSTFFIPTALLQGSAATRAIAAGTARRLAGGPVAFGAMERVDRDATGAGQRRPIALSDVPSAELARFSQAPAKWAGFDLTRDLIMGIVNVTPDSFSDGGDYAEAGAAIERGIALAEAGADILDIGGESTRPGSAPVSVEEEIRRVVPVIRALAEKGLCVSVDTRHAEVMAAAVESGARIINDVTALTGDPDSERVAAQSGADIVLMHMLGEPQTMQADPHYADVTLDLIDYFAARLARLELLGVPRARVSLDPGIGFGKKDPHNLRLLNELAAFHGFGCSLTLGVSRKSFIGRLSKGEAPKERMAGSITVAALGLAQGVQIVRVHDVPETFQMRAMIEALRRG
ncbi:dihydropteroate synthase [Dongia sp.]|uniref:dihydropteroate synthase n=1 Tax=Dongia sp. TaxID=1977262 RepID=UPI0035B435DF